MGSGLSDPARPLTPCIIILEEGEELGSLSWPLRAWGLGMDSRTLPRALSETWLWRTVRWLIHVSDGFRNAKFESQLDPEPV